VDFDADPLTHAVDYPGTIFPAGPVEERQRVATTQAQHPDRMLRNPRRQIDAFSDRQRQRAIKAGAIHRAIIRA